MKYATIRQPKIIVIIIIIKFTAKCILNHEAYFVNSISFVIFPKGSPTKK